ncbi:hypothetical protein EMCRGX_G013754 [Ephydatia muelleri]
MDSLSSSPLLSLAKVKEIYSVKAETMTSKGETYPSSGLQVKAELRPRSHDGALVPGAMELLITMDGQHILKSACNLNVRRTYSHQSMLSSELVVQQLPSITVKTSILPVGSIRVFDQAGQLEMTIALGLYLAPEEMQLSLKWWLGVSVVASDRVSSCDWWHQALSALTGFLVLAMLRRVKGAAAALNPQREAGRVQCGIYSVQHVGMGPSERKCKEHARLKLQGLDHQWNTLPPVPLNQDI